MKIIRNIIVIALVFVLISNAGQDPNNRLAAASETAQKSFDHSECQAQIAVLEAELEQARQTHTMILRIEIDFIPVLFGDGVKMTFHSTPIVINAAAAQTLTVGTDLSENADAKVSLIDHVIDCSIIVESVTSN